MNLIESTYKKLSNRKTLLILSEILIVIIIYLSTIIPSNESIIDKIITSPIWIPSGIFLSAVILLGNRKLISIFLGALIILFLILIYSTDVYGIGNSIIIAILIAIGETFEIYMAAYYYRKKIKTKTFINNSSLLIKFFILTIFISIIGATIGTVIIFIWHVNSELNYPIIWLNWAISHILSYMLLTPLILNWRYKSFVVWNKQRFLEASILLVVMIALTQIIFGELYPNSVIFAFPYLVIPLVLWVVIKFSYREIIFILVVLSVISILNTNNGNGPFITVSLEYSILNLQEYLLAVYFSALLLYSAISKLRETEKELTAYKNELELKVEARSNEIRQKNKRLEEEIEFRIKTEKRLKELSQAVEQSPASVIITDKNGSIIYANPKFIEMKGYNSEQIIGKNPRLFKSGVHDQKFYKNIWGTILNGKIWQGEILNKKKNGQLFWESALISPIFNENREIYNFVGIYEDISKQKEAEDEIQKYINKLSESEFQLQQLNQNKDKFFSILAHDLKGPFSSLLGFSEFLVNDFEELTLKEIKSYSINIHESTKNTYKLLENLLEWARIQRNKIEIEIKRINLYKIARSVIELYHNEAEKKKIKLVINISENCFVKADENTLSTVIRNLVSNAIKFCSANDKITLSAEEKGQNFEIKISDSGIGIDKEDLKKLFRIDVHHTRAGTAQEKGTGLGLILCKELLEKNNSQINVESTVGEGTTFTFNLPKSN